MEFKISVNFSISKISFAFKTHRATELRKKTKFDVFQKPLFCTLMSDRNMVEVLLLRNDHFLSFRAFSKK